MPETEKLLVLTLERILQLEYYPGKRGAPECIAKSLLTILQGLTGQPQYMGFRSRDLNPTDVSGKTFAGYQLGIMVGWLPGYEIRSWEWFNPSDEFCTGKKQQAIAVKLKSSLLVSHPTHELLKLQLGRSSAEEISAQETSAEESSAQETKSDTAPTRPTLNQELSNRSANSFGDKKGFKKHPPPFPSIAIAYGSANCSNALTNDQAQLEVLVESPNGVDKITINLVGRGPSKCYEVPSQYLLMALGENDAYDARSSVESAGKATTRRDFGAY